jgi:hypothetical protein
LSQAKTKSKFSTRKVRKTGREAAFAFFGKFFIVVM